MTSLSAALDVVGDDAVEFFGPPAALTATVAMRNSSDAPQRLRRTIPRRQSGTPDEVDVHAVHIGQRATLLPGGTDQVRLRMSVAPHTAPGDYQVRVDVGGTARPAVLHVAEVVDAGVSPDEIVIDNAPVEQVRTIAVTNGGNVGIRIGNVAVPFDDERFECRVLRATARQFSKRTDTDPDLGFDDYFVELVRQADTALTRAGLLRLRCLDGEVVVAPGQTQPVRIGLTVPETLDRHTRYTALVPIATSDVVVRVVPSLEPSGPGPEVVAPPAPAAAAPRAPAKKAAKKPARKPTKKQTAAKAPAKKPAAATRRGSAGQRQSRRST